MKSIDHPYRWSDRVIWLVGSDRSSDRVYTTVNPNQNRFPKRQKKKKKKKKFQIFNKSENKSHKFPNQIFTKSKSQSHKFLNQSHTFPKRVFKDYPQITLSMDSRSQFAQDSHFLWSLRLVLFHAMLLVEGWRWRLGFD
jgi:hypothetical protein